MALPDLGLGAVALDTGLQNTGAQALYEGYGFERTGVRRADIAANGRITMGWQAVGVPGSPVVYGNSVLAAAQSQQRLYLLDPSTGAVRSSVAET